MVSQVGTAVCVCVCVCRRFILPSLHHALGCRIKPTIYCIYCRCVGAVLQEKFKQSDTHSAPKTNCPQKTNKQLRSVTEDSFHVSAYDTYSGVGLMCCTVPSRALISSPQKTMKSNKPGTVLIMNSFQMKELVKPTRESEDESIETITNRIMETHFKTPKWTMYGCRKTHTSRRTFHTFCSVSERERNGH